MEFKLQIYIIQILHLVVSILVYDHSHHQLLLYMYYTIILLIFTIVYCCQQES